MPSLFLGSKLDDLVKKVEKGDRLNFQDGLRLMNSNDILALGYMANVMNERKNGNKTYFIANTNIKYTNVCKDGCDMCEGVEKQDPKAFTLSLSQIEKAAERVDQNISEINLIGSINPELSLNYYLEILKKIKNIKSHINLRAFTPVDIYFFSMNTKLTVSAVFEQLKEVGLDSLNSEGVYISPRMNNAGCELSIEEWSDIQETAHKLGMKTVGSFFYGHSETMEERVEHLIQLRNLQEKTAGFTTFLPVPFSSKNLNQEIDDSLTTGFDDLRMLAVSRILLDNFDHIKTLWAALGPKLAQVSLDFGVDDLGGTIILDRNVEQVDYLNKSTNDSMTKKQLVALIKKAGRQAIERDSFYRTLHDYTK